MNKDQETPEARRERLRQQELKRNPAAMHGGGFQDLIGDLGWKGTGILFLIIVIAIVIYLTFFN
ncbi:DUF6366 family protein [Solibacillus isronensis]|uniref:DUF6366 family protein n=1 Tax=Solibacillus isronensis TaxID=412383 RepID=UPI002041434B|nr:DUF6366 family protein [Solibacillus isronensis]MCM3721203.1 DUF6366 family protein [Solibacillus isronensis]